MEDLSKIKKEHTKQRVKVSKKSIQKIPSSSIICFGVKCCFIKGSGLARQKIKIGINRTGEV